MEAQDIAPLTNAARQSEPRNSRRTSSCLGSSAGRDILESERLFREACPPARHAPMIHLTSSPWQKSFDELRESLGGGFLCAMVGNRGTGKTQLGVELIRHSCLASRPALYCKALEIFMAIRATYDDKGKDEAAALRRFIAPALLVIDEAHERGESAWEDRLLSYLLDKRYDCVRDTILISNRTQDEFVKAIGPSVASRMQESGGIILCDWPSFRGMQG